MNDESTRFTLEAWVDHWPTWLDTGQLALGMTLVGELPEGADLEAIRAVLGHRLRVTFEALPTRPPRRPTVQMT
jgi:hypothetical protein